MGHLIEGLITTNIIVLDRSRLLKNEHPPTQITCGFDPMTWKSTLKGATYYMQDHHCRNRVCNPVSG